MNDFSELESELKKLRPAQPSAGLVARVEGAFAAALDSNQVAGPHLNPLPREGEADAERQVRVTQSTSTDSAKIIQPARFKLNWLSVGLGLAAAATFLVLARIDNAPPKNQNMLALASPAGTQTPRVTGSMVPAGLTEVVYHTQDEGLLYPHGSTQPMRRMRSERRETLQWRNPETGASLRVSYPSEEVTLTPISGQ